MVRKCSDILCKNLKDKVRNQTGVQYTRDPHAADKKLIKLERIQGKDGFAIPQALIRKLLESGSVGTSVNSIR